MKYNGKHFWDASYTFSISSQQHHTEEGIKYPYNNNLLDLTIYVSCYNEEAFIENTLTTIVSAMKIVNKSYEIIVIDDCSKDRSVDIVKKFIADNPRINIILRINKQNKGLAQNYIDAAFIGKGKYYRLICGDNAEPIETIVDVLKRIGEADIIIPYYVSAEGKSVYRQFLSKLYTKIINLISGNKIHYYNGLQVYLRHNVMRWHPNTRGFDFQAALLCLMLEMGFSYIQVPCVTIELRDSGSSALTWKNLFSVTLTMGRILLRRFTP